MHSPRLMWKLLLTVACTFAVAIAAAPASAQPTTQTGVGVYQATSERLFSAYPTSSP